MYINKTRMAILCCAMLAVFGSTLFAADGAPAKPKKTTKTQPSGDTTNATAAGGSATPQTTVALPQELTVALDEMLKMVNEGKKPSTEDVAAVANLLQQSKKDLLRFDAIGKTKYSLLTSWNNYFAGNIDGAVQAASAALTASPDDPDARATYTAMAVISGKYPMMGRLVAKPATAKKKPKTGEEEAASTTSTSAGVLNFDATALKPQASGKKITGLEANYNCIGGTTFAAGKSDLLCALAWRSVAVPKAAKPGASASASVPSEEVSTPATSDSDPTAAFGSLMVDYTGCDKVAFIGVNLDDAAARYNAMKEVGSKGWFWPQVMAQETTNKPLADLAKYDVSKPAMAIIAKDGTIMYMGSPAGFLPKLVLAKATDGYAPKLFVPSKATGAMDPNARKSARAADPNARGKRSMDPNAVKGKDSGDIDEAMQMGQNLKAEELYNNAKSFMKGSRTSALTAGRGVQLCRQILQDYPNTEYAGKARELMRELPDDLKTRYNITAAEMGQ
jgi:hypothetical protein